MRTRVIAAVLFATLWPCTGLGVEVKPPNPVPVYTLVRVVTVPGSDVWILSIIGGEIKEVDVEYAKDGVVVFTGAPGSYAVLVKEEGQQSTRVVTIAPGPVPPPGPPEPPGPGPGPGPLPDDTVPAKVSKLVLTHVPAANRVACGKLAESYRNLASRINVDLFTPESIREATKVENDKILAGQTLAWTKFYENLAKLLYDWSLVGPRTREDYRAMWLDIAAGLDLVTRRPVHVGSK